MCSTHVFEAFCVSSKYLNLVCSTDPLSPRQPTAVLSTDCCPAAAKGRRLFPWTPARSLAGECSGLTVALSSYISQELGLSGSRPVRIFLSSSKTKRVRKSLLPIFLIYKSTPIWGEDFINLILGYDIW